jgi:hypothetical protein
MATPTRSLKTGVFLTLNASIEAHFVVFLRNSKARNPDSTRREEEKCMDEEATPALAEEQGTVTTTTAVPQGTVITTTSGDVLSPQQAISHAAALGWAMAELLGRCFVLKDVQPGELDWSGDKVILLQEMYTPREKIRALMVHIRFLADALDVSSCLIDDESDPDNTRPYVEVLEEHVKLLTKHNTDALTREQMRGKVNEHLFFWDLLIHEMLQDRATTIPKAYVVGRSLAGLRWYFGLRDKVPDDDFMKKICNEYIPMLQPYVSPFASGALAYSLEPWWNAIAGGQVQSNPAGEGPIELQKQSNIWYSLMTCERDALSYAPLITGRRYIWRVLRVSWPMFLIGGLALVVILGLLLFVIISNPSIITKDVAAVVALLTTFGVIHTLGGTVGNILEKAVSEVTGTFRGTVIDNIRHSAQQEAVNKATFIPPASAHQNAAQNTQVKG